MLLYCIKSTLDCINVDLKAKVADNELYAAKLTKEKQERTQRSIKKTSTIGLQFNYLIPSMGKTEIYLYLTVYYTTYR